MVFQGTRSFGEGVAGLLRRSSLAHLLSDSGENLLWLRKAWIVACRLTD